LTTQTLLFAKLMGVRCRILHAHNDLRPRLAQARWLYRVYTALNLWANRQLANKWLACGSRAAEWTFGEGWRSQKADVDMVIGIDMEPFFAKPDAEMRARLGLPSDRFILAQIARLAPAKNHVFTIGMLAELVRRRVPVHLMLIGDGELRERLEKTVADTGLSDYCTWVRDSGEVATILRSAVDLHLIPSLNEGIPLVLVEAQTAGVRTVAADTLPSDGVIDPGLVRFLPIDKGPQPWADAIGALLLEGSKEPLAAEHCERMLSSRFNIARNVEELSRIYERLAQGAA